MTDGPNSPGVGPAAYQPACWKSFGASSWPLLSSPRSTSPLVVTLIEGIRRATGALGDMIGPKSDAGALAAAVDVVRGNGVVESDVVGGPICSWLESGCGGG